MAGGGGSLDAGAEPRAAFARSASVRAPPAAELVAPPATSMALALKVPTYFKYSPCRSFFAFKKDFLNALAR